MSPTLKINIATNFADTQELNYKYKTLVSREDAIDKILDDVNQNNTKLLSLLKKEEKQLERVEQLMSDSNDILYLEYLKNILTPTYKSKLDLYKLLKKHSFSNKFKSILVSLKDSIDSYQEVINDIDLKIDLLNDNFLKEIDEIWV